MLVVTQELSKAPPAGPPVLAYAQARGPDRRGKGPLAVAAGVLLPGLGHWVAGERPSAVRWFVLLIGLGLLACLCLAVPTLAPVCPILAAICIVLQVLQWISAYRAGRNSTRRMLPNPAVRYV